MSTADKPKATESHQATRQILDELDALMDRMMSLPVDDSVEPAESPARVEPDQPTIAAATIEKPRSAEPQTPEPIQTVSQEEPSDPEPPKPSYTIAESETKTEPEERPNYQTEDVSTEPAKGPEFVDVLPPITPVPKFEPPQTTNESPMRTGWRPLLFINETFDQCTRWMGRVGVWMRGRYGRAVLGLAGTALLIWAVAWGILVWFM